MKSKNLSLIFVGLLIFSMSMSIAYNANALNPKPAVPVTLKFWYSENPTEAVTLFEKIAWFESIYPEVTIDAEEHGFFTIGDEYSIAFVAGEEPDVLRTPRDDVPQFARDSMIAPLTDEFTSADKADFLEQSLKLMTYEGEIWGFPQAIDCPMILFNKDLFDTAGFNSSAIDWSTSWTWPEYSYNIWKLNQTAGVYATSLAGTFYSVQPYYYGQGAAFVENGKYDTGHITLNSTKSRAALEFMKNVTDSTVTPPWALQGWGTYVPDFGDGKVAMIVTGPWEINNLITNYDQFNGVIHGADNLGFMQLPHDEDDNYGALIGGNYYTISSQIESAKYEAAVNFVKFLSSSQVMAKSAIEDSHVPARKSVMTNATVMAAASFKYVQPYYEQCANAYSLPPSPYYGRLESALGPHVDNYLGGTETLDQMIGLTILEWYDILPPPTAAKEQVVIPGFPIAVVVATLLTGIFGVIIYVIKKRKN
ncbi:MAG: extracellular solute-binding protein [Promethearchaeota archaeon]